MVSYRDASGRSAIGADSFNACVRAFVGMWVWDVYVCVYAGMWVYARAYAYAHMRVHDVWAHEAVRRIAVPRQWQSPLDSTRRRRKSYI